MNDQPKPADAGWAANEHGEKIPAMRLQPKPAHHPLDCIVHPEGESPYTGMTEDEYRAVSDQPKPATGLTQEEQQTLVAGLCKELRELREQLAAERERADNAEARYASLHTMEADALREQLAAEREKVTAQQIANDMLTAQRNDLRKQLAAIDLFVHLPTINDDPVVTLK